MGRRPSAVATLVERQRRFLRLVRLPEGHRSAHVREQLTSELEQIPPSMRLSLTCTAVRASGRSGPPGGQDT